ncbi:MAG: helix-turn-helix domain-containing protein [Marmoricola sp.]
MDLSSITPSPTALKALTHPTRLRMLGLLRVEGPATATTLATRLGLNTGATSYHLRQLAEHGFVVEDTERGNARDRWWRAAQQATSFPSHLARSEDERQTLDAFIQAAMIVHTESLQAAMEERPMLSQEWRNASSFSDWMLKVPASRAEELSTRLKAIVSEWDEDLDAEDAADFVVQLHAFPRPGVVDRPVEPGSDE